MQRIFNSVRDLSPGDHACFIHKHDDDHQAILNDFLRTSFERKWKVLYIGSFHDEDYIRSIVADLPSVNDSGLLWLRYEPWTTCFPQGSDFDFTLIVDLMETHLKKAASEGFSGLSFTAEMAWDDDRSDLSRRLFHHHRHMTSRLNKPGWLSLCQYKIGRHRPRTLLEVLNIHPIAIINQTVHENFFFVDSQDFIPTVDPYESRLLQRFEILKRYKSYTEALRAGEEKTKAILQSMPDLIFQFDHEVRFLNFFSQDSSLLMLPPEQFIGRKVSEVLPPALAELTTKHVKIALETGEMQIYQYAVKTSEGVELDEEARIIRSAPNEAIAMIRDMTLIRAKEREIENRRQHMELIANALPMLVCHFGPDLRILYANRMSLHLFGREAGEVAGLSFFEILPPEMRNSDMTACLETALSGKMGESRVWLTAPGGEKRLIEITLVPESETGKPVHNLLLTGIDVTDRLTAEQRQKQLEAKIQQTQKMESLGILAGGIAHDFNNMLLGILGNASLALMELPVSHPAYESVRQIEAAALRSNELTKQMLAYSGKGRFIIEPVDLNDVVLDMSHLITASIPKNVAVKQALESPMPSTMADITQLRQVVMNLIINAGEAIGEKSGIITVSTGSMICDHAYFHRTFGSPDLPPGRYVFLEVSDTGCGMDQATLGSIFDPFFTTKFTGRGLGLAAVLGIIRGHLGAIRVYSEPGQGTTFKVLFPARDDSSVQSRSSAEKAVQSPVDGCILVIDDEEWVRSIARRSLEKVGLRVVTAVDGRQGLEIFEQMKDDIDLVLLDLTMPVMDGKVTYQEIRRIRDDVKVILSSGYSERDSIIQFTGKALAGFLQKPYKPADLIEKVKLILGHQPRTQE